MKGTNIQLSEVRRILLPLAAVVAMAGLVAGCEDDPLANGLPSQVDCSSCHGDASSPAPPLGVEGENSTTEVAVGAHREHLVDGPLRRAIGCEECHVVPATIEQAGHIDPSPAEVTFGVLASTEGATPAWDRSTVRCSGSYCHGATLTGGVNTTPSWTAVGIGEAACGTCHGAPPPAPHPDDENCNACHPQTVSENGEINVAGGYHINGVIESSGLSCNSCHGSAENAAPPVDTNGNSDTSLVTVGAHQAHLAESDWRAPIACAECHVVPSSVDASGHIDGAPAEVTWGTLATADAASPAWSTTAATCSGVYCHGATLEEGGTNTEPLWTAVGEGEAACGTCHGLPPAAPHPYATLDTCGNCHGETIDNAGDFVDPSAHIDGQVQLSMSCNSCHGSAENAAPPVDTNGNSDTAQITVGAHQSHLGTSAWHREMLCSDCHVVPTAIDDPAHIDGAPAEIVWSTLAEADAASPSWSTASATCAGVYCHGATLITGGTNTVPQWTIVGGGEAACGTCHGLPPASPHPSATLATCGNCHGETIDNAGVFVDPSKHIDGQVQVSTTCSSCHGGADNAAPPVDTSGMSDPSLVTVGAHQAHLATSDWRAPIACTECHVVPAAVDDAGHIDSSPAELTWGSLASADSAAPGWDHATATCADVYCHGGTLTAGGGDVLDPVWTDPVPFAMPCGPCHSMPPDPPHPVNYACSTCHSAVIDDAYNFIAPELHVNGVVNFGT